MSGDTKNGTGSRSNNKVLVTAATGKAGYKICLALVDAGFDVYGTTRSASTGADKLTVMVITRPSYQRYSLTAERTNCCF